MKTEKEKGPCPICGRWKNRAMTVDSVVIRDGHVLLIRRNNDPFKGFWALPGGYMDFDETSQEAAMRELNEETGLVAKGGDFIGVYSQPARHPQQVVSAVYLVTEFTGKAIAGDDAAETAWFALDDIPSELAFDHRQIIEDAIKYFKTPRGGAQKQ
ncbi:MAG: NUDIX hydrolase [Spirochaetaceae bacterium]|nr:MAG: NUDIX hydrolase [Spirochaetaceae bacterium]